MKKLFTVIGMIAAITAVVMSSTLYYDLAILPLIIAFVSGIILIYISKKEHSKTKPIQYIFLLVIFSLSLTIYKSVTSTIVDEQAIQTEQESTENLNDSQGNLIEIEPEEEP